jgi:hypothetical protein
MSLRADDGFAAARFTSVILHSKCQYFGLAYSPFSVSFILLFENIPAGPLPGILRRASSLQHLFCRLGDFSGVNAGVGELCGAGVVFYELSRGAEDAYGV